MPIREWVSSAVDAVRDSLAPLFDGFAAGVEAAIGAMLTVLQLVPAPGVILAFAALATGLAGWRVGLFALAGLALVHNVGLWQPFVQTLSLVLAAQALILVVGVPLGVLAARSDAVERVLRPVLDFMQTMPSFVYLIPAVMLFGLGTVPGVLATVVFALPPLVRLTNLGIRQVPVDLVEAGEAFGSSPLQMLAKVQLPVALPTIMAGVNQSIMLALSMVVIAAMIGAGGLGAEVLRGIQRLQIGTGFEAGLAVVLLAMTLDRLTQSVGKSRRTTEGG